MPSYKYRVIGKDGNIEHGKINALSKANALEKLKEEDLQPIRLKPMVDRKRRLKKSFDYNNIKFIKEPVKKRKKPKPNILKMQVSDLKDLNLFARVKPKDVIIFSNNLYILKKARFNNVQALQAIYDGAENPAFKDVIEDILIGVQSGEKIYSIMADYPKIFPPMYTNFIRVGEESGSLDTALLYARDYLDQYTILKKKVKSAVVPRVLQFFGIMIMMFVTLIIGVPILEDVYKMFGSEEEIPRATLLTLDIAQWCVRYWYILVAIVAIPIIIWWFYTRTPRGRYNWDKFLILGPVIGPLIRNIIMSNFFQAMLLNIKNGLRLQESLDISKNVTRNYYYLSSVESGRVNTQTGKSWIEPFTENKIFTPMVTQMLTIGMKTDLAEMMEKVNEYIKMEIEEALDKFVKVLPEITYAIVGVALIWFVLTVMVPLTNVYMGTFITMY